MAHEPIGRGAGGNRPDLQIADRWHLLKNLREALLRLVARFPAQIRTAAQQSAVHPEEAASASQEQAPPSARPLTQSERLVLQHRQRRLERYEAGRFCLTATIAERLPSRLY